MFVTKIPRDLSGKELELLNKKQRKCYRNTPMVKHVRPDFDLDEIDVTNTSHIVTGNYARHPVAHNTDDIVNMTILDFMKKLQIVE